MIFRISSVCFSKINKNEMWISCIITALHRDAGALYFSHCLSVRASTIFLVKVFLASTDGNNLMYCNHVGHFQVCCVTTSCLPILRLFSTNKFVSAFIGNLPNIAFTSSVHLFIHQPIFFI